MDGWRGDSRLSDDGQVCGGPSWSVAAEPGSFTLVESGLSFLGFTPAVGVNSAFIRLIRGEWDGTVC